MQSPVCGKLLQCSHRLGRITLASVVGRDEIKPTRGRVQQLPESQMYIHQPGKALRLSVKARARHWCSHFPEKQGRGTFYESALNLLILT